VHAVTLRPVFEWLNELPSSIAIRESLYGYPVLLTAHVVTMAVFAGLIVMMDLRLVGLAYRQTPVSEIQRRLFPWQMMGFVLSGITGMVLFYGQPMRYFGKVFFWSKMALMVFAGLNALWFHRTTYRTIVRWDEAPNTPFGARMAGAVSIALWTGVVLFGRLTAYQWLTFE
jgi:hypothetical protein